MEKNISDGILKKWIKKSLRDFQMYSLAGELYQFQWSGPYGLTNKKKSAYFPGI
jgi:hypothetical protein